jgi:hypothetical protein
MRQNKPNWFRLIFWSLCAGRQPNDFIGSSASRLGRKGGGRPLVCDPGAMVSAKAAIVGTSMRRMVGGGPGVLVAFRPDYLAISMDFGANLVDLSSTTSRLNCSGAGPTKAYAAAPTTTVATATSTMAVNLTGRHTSNIQVGAHTVLFGCANAVSCSRPACLQSWRLRMFGIPRPASGKDEAQAGQAEAHAHEQAYENIDRFHRFLRPIRAPMETHQAHKVSDVDRYILPARLSSCWHTHFRKPCGLTRHGSADRYINYGFRAGTGTPGIFTLTAPRWFLLVK